MAIPIPSDFDFRTIPLDENETLIRDALGLNIDHWARFRHAIGVGLDAANLRGKYGVPVTENIKSAYRELGKSHYEVVTSLGYIALSLALARNGQENLLMFQKSCKDFYFHAGCLLDNLARLIYILNDPNSANKIDTRYRDFKRHVIGWGQLKGYPGHNRAMRSEKLRGIKNIRNCLTHSWKIPFKLDQRDRMYWPLAVRSAKSFLWPYDESEFKHRYRKWVPIVPMMESDLGFLERFQDERFKRLIKDISRFERSNKVEIAEP
jgi:hypothetical protein